MIVAGLFEDVIVFAFMLGFSAALRLRALLADMPAPMIAAAPMTPWPPTCEARGEAVGEGLGNGFAADASCAKRAAAAATIAATIRALGKHFISTLAGA